MANHPHLNILYTKAESFLIYVLKPLQLLE